MPHDRPAVFQDVRRQELQQVFERFTPPTGLSAVLDAGCGYKLPIDIPREAKLTGIDVSPAALEKNTNADDLILGDVQSYPLTREAYDAVICWWVLEHLPRPADALVNMAGCLRPGGLLVVGIPHLYSLKAIVTKCTPYRFHVWVVKHFFGIANAGEPGMEPYPTFLRLDLVPSRLEAIMAAHSMTRVFSEAHASGDEARLPAALRLAWDVVVSTARLLTFGRWEPNDDEYVAIFQKQPVGAPSGSPRVQRGPT